MVVYLFLTCIHFYPRTTETISDDTKLGLRTFREDDDVREKTPQRERTPENDIESTCGVVTVSEEMLERNGIEEKVRKEHGKQGVYISK